MRFFRNYKLNYLWQSRLILSYQAGLLVEKHQCWLNTQYSRWEYLDIVGIPSEVEADALEEKVVAIFENLGCNISTKQIEACHRISKKNPTFIVKFLRRKDSQQIWDVREDIDLPGKKSYLSTKPYAHITRWCAQFGKSQEITQFRQNL